MQHQATNKTRKNVNLIYLALQRMVNIGHLSVQNVNFHTRSSQSHTQALIHMQALKFCWAGEIYIYDTFKLSPAEFFKYKLMSAEQRY